MNEEFNLTDLTWIKSQEMLRKGKGKNALSERKNRLTRHNMFNMYRRTLQMFKWSGLPYEIPQRNLELTIQTRGFACIYPCNGKHYQGYAGLGEKPNYNYMPTVAIVSNPYLKLSSQRFEIYDTEKGKANCVIIPNDSLYQGMNDTLSLHSELITEVQLTKLLVMILSRYPALLTAPNNNEKQDLMEVFEDLEGGSLKVILEKSFLNQINSVELGKDMPNNLITQLNELEQYEKASEFNDIGLQMNYNMKRESITSSEAQLGESALLPLPDDMMDMRKESCKRIKEVFDLNWGVEFGSAWKDLRKSIFFENKKLENEAEGVQTTEQSEENQEGGEENDTTETETTVQEPEE